MTHAYTPGLKVSRQTEVKKERRLPLKGDVLVGIGDRVTAETIVAKTELPGNVQTVNVANRLSILPEDIERNMLAKVGDWVDEGQLIAESRSFFGLFKSNCKMPASGTIESVSNITGQVIIRERAIPVEVDAYVDGEVIEVFEDEGVMVKTTATFVQGIFGIGGETNGPLRMACSEQNQKLTEELILKDMQGQVIVGGSLVTVFPRTVHEALSANASVGIATTPWSVVAVPTRLDTLPALPLPAPIDSIC